MPDAALAPLAAASPRAWWRLTLAATTGSCLGGVLSHTVGRTWPPHAILARLPLVRPAMVGAADGWLADEGALALRHQPLSGLPYKVFALLAGGRGIPLSRFVLATAVFRGLRFLAVSGAAALVGRRFEGPISRNGALLLAAWLAVFAVGLRRMVATWERRPITSGVVAPL